MHGLIHSLGINKQSQYFQIVTIGNKSAAMAEADPGAAPPTEGGGAESGDGTIVRGQQFLVGPR